MGAGSLHHFVVAPHVFGSGKEESLVRIATPLLLALPLALIAEAADHHVISTRR
jgi:hypothetical protein